jgi:hypothetical protein
MAGPVWLPLVVLIGAAGALNFAPNAGLPDFAPEFDVPSFGASTVAA